MSAKEKIDRVNTHNLRWARRKSGLDIVTVYKRAGWKRGTGKIEKWESGEDYPTVSELRKLGDVYKKPWVFFIMKQNAGEMGFSVMADFRSMIDSEIVKKHPSVIEFLNELEGRQKFLLEFSDELELKRNKIIGSAGDIRDPREIAGKIIRSIGIDMDEFRGKKTRSEGLRYLIECVGEHDIFVSATPAHKSKKIPITVMRGVILKSDRAPVIGINTNNESDGAKIFTLFHELAHLFTEKTESFTVKDAVGKEEIEITTINFRDGYSGDPKERLCNQVAGYILVPDSELEKLKGKKIDSELVKDMCVRLKVNNEPFLIRACQFGLISDKEKESLSAEIREEYLERTVGKSSGEKGGGAPVGDWSLLARNGRTFFRAVRSLHDEGHISFMQALNVLNMKAGTYRKFDKKI